MVCASDLRPERHEFEPSGWQCTRIVLLGKTLHSHSAFPHPGYNEIHSLLYENEFGLLENKTSFSYERVCTCTYCRLGKEFYENSFWDGC